MDFRAVSLPAHLKLKDQDKVLLHLDEYREYEGKPEAPHAVSQSGIADRTGAVQIQSWYAGWQSARLCPSAPFTQELTAELLPLRLPGQQPPDVNHRETSR